jgi:hypothetical protein
MAWKKTVALFGFHECDGLNDGESVALQVFKPAGGAALRLDGSIPSPLRSKEFAAQLPLSGELGTSRL